MPVAAGVWGSASGVFMHRGLRQRLAGHQSGLHPMQQLGMVFLRHVVAAHHHLDQRIAEKAAECQCAYRRRAHVVTVPVQPKVCCLFPNHILEINCVLTLPLPGQVFVTSSRFMAGSWQIGTTGPIMSANAAFPQRLYASVRLFCALSRRENGSMQHFVKVLSD
jgi:hypothetical protein